MFYTYYNIIIVIRSCNQYHSNQKKHVDLYSLPDSTIFFLTGEKVVKLCLVIALTAIKWSLLQSLWDANYCKSQISDISDNRYYTHSSRGVLLFINIFILYLTKEYLFITICTCTCVYMKVLFYISLDKLSNLY